MGMTRALAMTLPALAITAVSSQAFAAVVTTTTQVPISVAATAQGATTTTFSVAIPQFNPSLGTLTGVNLSISLNSGVDVYDGKFFFTPGATFTTALTKQNVYLYQNAVSTTVAADLEEPVYAPAYTGIVPAAYVYVGTVYAALTGAYDASNVSSFVGTGTTPVSYSVVADPSITTYNYANGRLYTNPGAQTGTETITYTYTAAVPEPASLGLLAGGAILLMRRRRA